MKNTEASHPAQCVQRRPLPWRPLALLLAACSSVSLPAVSVAAADAATAPFVAVIEREVPAILQANKIQGAAVGLIVGGKLVYAKGFGFADHAGKVAVTPDTVFVAASLSKPIAAWVTQSLASDGTIALDQPVAELVSPWPLAASRFDAQPITVRQLLSHTAGTSLGGYQGWLDYAELPSLEESLAGKTNGRGAVERVNAPGSKFDYSGGGYTLLQLALERKTGRHYAELAQERVFKPLGMHRSNVEMSPRVLRDAAQGHGEEGEAVPMRYYAEQAPSGLSTSVNDFARWMMASMDSATRSPLSAAQRKALYQPASLSTPRAPNEAVYGLGHFIERLADGTTAVGHDGRNQAGFRAKFLLRPQQGDGIVFLSNSRTGLALDRIVCLWAADAAKADAASCKP